MSSVRRSNKRGNTDITTTPHTFTPMQHHAAMQSIIVKVTPFSIRIKQLMLDLYNWQLRDEPLKANAYYAKVITANEMTALDIKEKHRGKHGITPANLEKLIVEVNTLRGEMIREYGIRKKIALKDSSAEDISNMMKFINEQVKIVLSEISYNDHFIFELMTDLMLKANLSINDAAKEVRHVLDGEALKYLADDEVYLNRLSEISNRNPSPTIYKRFISPLETNYALSSLRLQAVQALMDTGYRIDEAFDEVCQSEGEELLDTVNRAKARNAALKAAANSNAEKNPPLQLVKPEEVEVKHVGHPPAKTKDETKKHNETAKAATEAEQKKQAAAAEDQKAAKDAFLKQKQSEEAAANAAFMEQLKREPNSIANTHVLPSSRMIPESVELLLCAAVVAGGLYFCRQPILFVAGKTLDAAKRVTNNGIIISKAAASYWCGNKTKAKADEGDDLEENQGLIVNTTTVNLMRPTQASPRSATNLFSPKKKTTSPATSQHSEERDYFPAGLKKSGSGY